MILLMKLTHCLPNTGVHGWWWRKFRTALLSTTLLCKLSVLLSSIGLVIDAQVYAGEVLVAAASDLAPILPEIASVMKKNNNLTVRSSIGSSGQLARQIEQGAPFDLFLSADEDYVKRLTVAGHTAAGTVRIYAEGRLALWSKGGNIRSLKDLRGLRRVAVANPAYAPYGRLAKQALEQGGLWEALQPALIYGESVRQTMQYAETGNVDAALVSWTLVHDKGGVLLPDSIRQAGAVLKRAKNPSGAAALMAYLASPDGRLLLQGHGLFATGNAPLQDLKDHDGNGQNGGANEKAKKSKGLGAAKERKKNK